MENNKPIDEEIAKILGESPIVSQEQKANKIQTYKPRNLKFNKKTMFIGLGIIVAIFILYLIVQESEPCVCDLNTAQDTAVNEFAYQVRQSVIDNGWVNINIDGKALKLAPYTG